VAVISFCTDGTDKKVLRFDQENFNDIEHSLNKHLRGVDKMLSIIGLSIIRQHEWHENNTQETCQ